MTRTDDGGPEVRGAAPVRAARLSVPLSDSICSLFVSGSHFGDSCTISNFSLLLYSLCWDHQ